jgi:hypothetical protein
MVTETKIYKASLKEVYDAALEALKKCGFKIKECKEDSIKATSGISLFSWGESIEISIRPEYEGVRVEVSSVPVAQLFDWGKSRENISKIFSNLEAELSKRKGR